jgi:hypothetical protein
VASGEDRPGVWAAAFREGLHVARLNAVPAAVVIAGIVSLVIGYYRVPAVAQTLQGLMELKLRWGLVFAFVAGGISSGVIAEVYIVLFGQGGRWTRTNTKHLVFKFILFGVSYSIVDGLYWAQAQIFGEALTWRVVVPKVLVDQFIFNPLWAAPFQGGMLFLMHRGFSREEVRAAFTLAFYRKHILPVLVSTWFVWIPSVTCVYCLPLPLQLPVCLLTGMFWGLILASLSLRSAQRRDDAA